MASTLLGLTASVIVIVLGALLRINALHVIIVTLISFGIIFFASRFVIKRFFIYKIKPIYQIVTSNDISTKLLIDKYSDNDDIVEDVRDELTHWAAKKAKEISRLKDNERYRKEFLGNVSHEIKTPIFTIQGYILTLLDGALEEPGINRLYLERAEKNIDRLINILTDMDSISRLESGEMVLEYRIFDIVSLARDIVDSLHIDADRKSITLRVNGTSPHMVEADKSHIGQVLVNLISNSIKYGKEGGTTTINFIDMIDKIIVEVEDDGIGIENSLQARIFERFYRVDKSRSREQGGTGLGLAIVKHILEAHGEKITLRSTPDKGTTFTFTLSKADK